MASGGAQAQVRHLIRCVSARRRAGHGLAARQAGIDPQSCFLLATNALDATLLSPQELFAGYKGQVQTEQ
jgi:hypothetical protein